MNHLELVRRRVVSGVHLETKQFEIKDPFAQISDINR
jgi:hypothetical protein